MLTGKHLNLGTPDESATAADLLALAAAFWLPLSSAAGGGYLFTDTVVSLGLPLPTEWPPAHRLCRLHTVEDMKWGAAEPPPWPRAGDGLLPFAFSVVARGLSVVYI